MQKNEILDYHRLKTHCATYICQTFTTQKCVQLFVKRKGKGEKKSQLLQICISYLFPTATLKAYHFLCPNYAQELHLVALQQNREVVNTVFFFYKDKMPI